MYPFIQIHNSFPSDNTHIVFGCSKHGFVGKQVVRLTVSALEGLSDLVVERLSDSVVERLSDSVAEEVIGWVIGGVIGSVVKRTFAS